MPIWTECENHIDHPLRGYGVGPLGMGVSLVLHNVHTSTPVALRSFRIGWGPFLRGLLSLLTLGLIRWPPSSSTPLVTSPSPLFMIVLLMVLTVAIVVLTLVRGYMGR
jgi:hypothetical protein